MAEEKAKTLYVTGNPRFRLDNGEMAQIGVLDVSKLQEGADVEFLKESGAVSDKKPLALIETEAAK